MHDAAPNAPTRKREDHNEADNVLTDQQTCMRERVIRQGERGNKRHKPKALMSRLAMMRKTREMVSCVWRVHSPWQRMKTQTSCT